MPEVDSRFSRRQLLRATGIASAATIAGCLGDSDDDGSGDGGDDGSGDGGDDGNGDDGGDGGEKTTWRINGAGEGSPVNTWMEGFAAVMDEHGDTPELSPELANSVLSTIAEYTDESEPLDAGFTWAGFIYNAQQGRREFAEDGRMGPLEGNMVQAMSPAVHHGYWFLCTYADRDDIEDIYDLEGQTVSIHLRGELQNVWLKDLMEATDIEVGQWRNENFVNSGNTMSSRNADATFVLATNGSLLVPPHADAWAANTMKGVEMPEDALETAREEVNKSIEWSEVHNEDLNQPGDFDSVNSFVLASVMGVGEQKDNELVHEFTKTVHDNQEELEQYHPAFEAYGFGEGRNGFEHVQPIQYHEGAIQYFEEEGIDYPEPPE